MYHCVCCNTPLFPSNYKFDSGSGWPSFFETHRSEDKTDNIRRKTDRSLMMSRRRCCAPGVTPTWVTSLMMVQLPPG